jgi:uracil-DNA glycosylase family protein
MPSALKRDPRSHETQSVSAGLAVLENERPSLPWLRRAAQDCKACDLWKHATQTVFGEGAPRAAIMFVGEQPGDQEDLAGHPFVGPAGKLLDEALHEAGIDRSGVYVTNVVKHFKWSPAERGKRRIHKKPRYSEIKACRPWIDAEIKVVKPEVLVCLGATAAQALLGRGFSVTRQRGLVMDSQLAPKVLATVHPSSILRAPDAEARQSQMKDFVRDLSTVAELVANPKQKPKPATGEKVR